MGLFKPGWMSKDENKAMRSLDRVSDDEELYRIATECPHLNVQIRAVSRIRDADRRLDVALTKRLISLNVRRAALEGASEERLCLVAGKAPMCDIRLEAVDRMSDDTFLAKLVLDGAGGSRDDKRVCEAAYEKMEHPPFECSMLMCSRKADENLLHDVEGMTYPADREKLLRVVREKEGEAAGRAVTKLPYEQEREVLRELAMNGKGLARSAAVASLHLPADRDIADSIIAEPKSGRNLKQHAVRLLPEDDPVLNELCCPFCGALGSVFHHGGYDDAVDMYYSAYECRVCGREVRKHSVTGTAEVKDFSITLRQLRSR